MANLPAIVRATRASANALSAMARHARAAADASGTMAHNYRMLAAGHITADAAAMGNRIAAANKLAAMHAWRRASRRFDAAQITLANNPI